MSDDMAEDEPISNVVTELDCKLKDSMVSEVEVELVDDEVTKALSSSDEAS